LLATFSFDTIGAKEKVIKKKTPLGEFRALRSARRLTQPPLRHLLKKVDENFHTGFVRTFYFLLINHPQIPLMGKYKTHPAIAVSAASGSKILVTTSKNRKV
jgi:hypothetical protein